jgi:hypothetical protein
MPPSSQTSRIIVPKEHSNNDDSNAEAVVDIGLEVAIEVKRVTAKVEPRKR